MSWATALEAKRGRAVNENTIQAWFDLVQETETEYEILPENDYATDEIGTNPFAGERERVMGGNDRGPQYQQRDGTRENITSIVTICADGTSIPPAVLFKGQAFQASWKQNNPANASLGYSKKGWTNGEIGVEWIKNFDKHTSAKAKHRYRRLTVDGHNSHYTRAFLEYARAHRIIVICYPSHATHVLQGLDVVIFAVLKRYISEERDRWERETGESVGKSNFLAIFGRAHIRALTPDLIKTAFRKTGISPFDRNVVSKDNMAPSKESSCEGRLP
ncbi:DDE-domain-containing protein, partial [Athelia psychrophila]